MITRVLQVSLFMAILLSLSNGDDHDENSRFYYNTRMNCQANNYFDIDHFKCRLCDPNFNLVASELKHKCICDKNSTELFEYDNIHKRPICDKTSKKKPAVPNVCTIRYVNATKFSSIRKSVMVYRAFENESCTCDEKNNDLYRGYCIRSELFKDLKGYQLYKNAPLSQTLNLSHELKFIVFFCQVLHQRNYCNYLANLCVLTHYDLDKNGPCSLFYTQQNGQNEISIDELSNVGSELDGAEKVKPFLFFRKAAKNLFKKSIDFPYRVNNANSTINFTVVSYDLRGNLLEMRQLKLGDLNLCNRFSAPVSLWQPNVMFAKNFASKCTINLQELIELQADTKFSSLYLNYYEGQARFLQTVPISIRNAFEVNKLEDIEKWQLVKRFFLIDTISGRQSAESGKTAPRDDDSREKLYEQFSQINFVQSIELLFFMDRDDEKPDEINRISVPLLVIEYGTLNLTHVASNIKLLSSGVADESELYNINFSFKIKFVKTPNLNFFFQIILPILSSLAFLYALMQTFFFKVRQQKVEYDLAILSNFIVNLLGNIANAFFAFILMFTCYVFVVYKTQSDEIKIMLPMKREEKIIEALLVVSIICKALKLSEIFYNIINIDIFFIDFERPKYTHDNFLHGSQKSQMGTPSISSSLKPSASTPTNECVSAWRNYFIANEWHELMTKRKISIDLHILFVVGALMVFGFENYSSMEFELNLNATLMHDYVSLLKSDNSEEADNRLLKVAVGSLVYLALYLSQRLYNFLIYERFVDNCLQQFIDVSSIANISVLILQDSYGFYIHGRSVHGRSDIDTFNMILQFKREEENLVGHRGLLPGGDHQTYTIMAPKNLRLFYEKLINPITSKTNHNHNQFNNQSINFEKMILTYHNINRFFAAFIDHALKDVDYEVKEKNLFEKLFDCEMYTTASDSKGVFYFDNGHSFDKVLFYGNEGSIFCFEYLLFVFLLFTTGNFLIAALSIGIVFKLIKEIINHLAKNNLARKTLIDKRFLI